MSANLWRAWWAWLVTFLATIAISAVTKPKPDGELVGLVKGLTPALAQHDVAWFRRPMFWAAVSLLVLIALNIYFF